MSPQKEISSKSHHPMPGKKTDPSNLLPSVLAFPATGTESAAPLQESYSLASSYSSLAPTSQHSFFGAKTQETWKDICNISPHPIQITRGLSPGGQWEKKLLISTNFEFLILSTFIFRNIQIHLF